MPPQELQPKMASLGVVGKPHGLKGHFYFEGRVDVPSRSLWPHFFVRLGGASPANWKPSPLEECRQRGSMLIGLLSLANTREAIERWRGAEIAVPQEFVVSQPQVGIVYWNDLIKKSVLTQDGIAIGQVEFIYNAGASDIAHIKGILDAKVYVTEIPLVPDFVDFTKADFLQKDAPLVLRVGIAELEPLRSLLKSFDSNKEKS